MRLMIVESPTKARKLSSFLGPEWVVKASIGHVVDLPLHELGIEPNSYHLTYQPSERGRDVLKALKPLAARATQVVLATDPDREGEAIAFHLQKQLGLKTYDRVTFHEITEKSVRAALAAPRKIDAHLVQAQEARRAMDRLIGYKISPALSALHGSPLSAGRCQTPAVQLVAERNAEIENFKPQRHFGASASFDGWQAVWQPKPNDALILDEALAARAAACREFIVTHSDKRQDAVPPPAPFTTSALLQVAGSKLRVTSKAIQALMQSLFENGHITYHRTDSPDIDNEAATQIREFIAAQGLTLAPVIRHFAAKSGAQEAHGAIRPTHINVERAGTSEAELALYQLIRDRALASQLADARYDLVTLTLESDGSGFTARGRTLLDKGWQTLTAPDDDEASESAEQCQVPLLAIGAKITASGGAVIPRTTKPPAPFTEATLIQKLEQLGIGRPSTFAAIINHIIERGYVGIEHRHLLLQPSGLAIVKALAGTSSCADYAYSKQLEERLDHVAAGTETYFALVSEIDHTLERELHMLDQQTAH